MGVDRMLCGSRSSAGWSRWALYVQDLRVLLAFWRGRQAYTASASGGAARVQDPFGIPSGLATLSVYSTPDRLHSNEKGRRRCSVGLRATPVPGERADEQGPHSVRRHTRADSFDYRLDGAVEWGACVVQSV